MADVRWIAMSWLDPETNCESVLIALAKQRSVDFHEGARPT